MTNHIMCKVWSNDGVGSLESWEDGVMGVYSVKGIRSPHLDGDPEYFIQAFMRYIINQHNIHEWGYNAAISHHWSSINDVRNQ